MQEIIIAILTGGVATALIAWLREWNKSRSGPKKVIHHVARTYDVLNNICSNTGAERALVLRTENGGRRQSVGGHRYVSIIYEVSTRDLGPLKDTFQRRAIDRGYNDLLAKIVKEGVVIVDISEMPPSTLQNIYQNIGIRSAVFFDLSDSKEHYFFGSITSTEEGMLKGLDGIKLEGYISDLKNQFESAKKQKLL